MNRHLKVSSALGMILLLMDFARVRGEQQELPTAPSRSAPADEFIGRRVIRAGMQKNASVSNGQVEKRAPSPKAAAAESTALQQSDSEVQWIVLGKGNHYDGNVTDEVAQALQKLTEKGEEAKWIAFAPGGGWVILYGKHGHVSRHLPDEANRAIGNLANRENVELKSINFAPDGGFVILYGRNDFLATKVPDDIASALKRVQARGGELKSIAFGPGGACVFFYNQTGYFTWKADEATLQNLNAYATRYNPTARLESYLFCFDNRRGAAYYYPGGTRPEQKYLFAYWVDRKHPLDQRMSDAGQRFVNAITNRWQKFGDLVCYGYALPPPGKAPLPAGPKP
jgi:hypothetical protein